MREQNVRLLLVSRAREMWRCSLLTGYTAFEGWFHPTPATRLSSGKYSHWSRRRHRVEPRDICSCRGMFPRHESCTMCQKQKKRRERIFEIRVHAISLANIWILVTNTMYLISNLV